VHRISVGALGLARRGAPSEAQRQAAATLHGPSGGPQRQRSNPRPTRPPAVAGAPQAQKGGETIANATGNVANDFYHRWRDDVATMKKLGVKTYRRGAKGGGDGERRGGGRRARAW
jgi:hypothetical protein